MAAGDIALKVILTASMGNTLGQISQLAGALSGPLTNAFTLAASAAVIGLGTYAVKAASDFQSSLAKVQAYAGYTKAETEAMGQSILQMAPQLGEAPKALSDALYMVASAGFKGASSLQILRYAGMTAAASNSDATVVTKDLVGALSAMGLGADQAGNIMDELNATVKNGLLTWDTYGSVVGKLAGAVSIAGGSTKLMQSNFASLNAAMDIYSNTTVTAHQASMWLAADMTFLDGKTSTIAKNAAKLGLQFDMTKFKTMDFAQQVKYLSQVTDGNHDELVKLLGGNSTVANSIQFLNNHYKNFSSVLADITSKMKNGQTTQGMFAIAQQTLAFKTQQAQAALQSVAIAIGSILIPVISNILSFITPMIGAFAGWISNINNARPVLIGLGVAVAVTLIPVMWNLAAATISATWPFLLIAAAVGVAVAIFQHFYQTNAPFRAFIDNLVAGLKQLWQIIVANVVPAWQKFTAWIQGTLLPAMQQAWNWISTNFVAGWKAMAAWFQSSFLPAMQNVGKWFMTTIWPALVQIGQFIAANFVPVWQQLVSTWNNQLLPAFAAIGQIIRNQLWPVLQQLWQVIVTQLWPQLQQLWPVLKIIGMIIGGVVVVAFVFLIGVISGVVRAIATLIAGIVQFVGGVIQFFAGLWQALSGVVQLIVDLVTGHFSKLGADLQQIWSGIQNMWSGLWAAAQGIYKTFVGTVVSYVQGFISTIVGLFQNLFNKLVGHSIIPDLINGAISWFAQLPGKAVGFISGMVSNLIGKFVDLNTQGIAKIASLIGGIASRFGQAARDALNWGANIVQSILSGIQNAWNALVNWLSGALNNIKNMFPHSPVKEGPLRGLETWGGNIVSNLVASMQAATPQLTSAANAMALAVNGPLGNSGFAVKGGSFALSGRSTVLVQVQPGEISIDKRKLGDIMFTHQMNESRRTGPVKNR